MVQNSGNNKHTELVASCKVSLDLIQCDGVWHHSDMNDDQGMNAWFNYVQGDPWSLKWFCGYNSS